MAELINEIVTKEAFEQVEKLSSKLEKLVESLGKSAQVAKTFNTNLSKSNSLESVTENTKKATKALTEMEKVQKQVKVTTEQLKIAESKEQKQLIANRELRSQLHRDAKLEVQDNQSKVGSYKKLEAQLSKMKRSYKELSKVERESAKGNELQVKIQKTTSKLKELDKGIGVYNRNVGNYSSALAGLKSSFLALFSVTAGITAFFNTIKQGLESARTIEGVRFAFKKLNDPKLLDNLREATKGTVNDLELMKGAVVSNNLGVPIKNLGTFFQFAQQRAEETGESVDYLVDSIVKGIGRKSPLILDNLGISAIQLKQNLDGVSLAQATTGQVADAVGKIIQKNNQATGKGLDTNNERLKKAKASWENVRTELGEKLLPIVTNTTALFTALGAILLQIPLPLIVTGIGLVTIALIAQNKELIKSKILMIQDTLATITLANAKKTLAGSLRVVGTGFKRLYVIMMANPILAVLALVTGLVLWFGKLVSKNKSVVQSFSKLRDAFASISKALSPIIGVVLKFVTTMANVLAPLLEKFTNSILVPLANHVLPRITLSFKMLSGGISAFTSLFLFSYEKVKNIAGGYYDMMKGIFTLDKDLIKKGVNAQVDGIKTLFKGLGKAGKEGFLKGFNSDKGVGSGASGGDLGGIALPNFATGEKGKGGKDKKSPGKIDFQFEDETIDEYIKRMEALKKKMDKALKKVFDDQDGAIRKSVEDYLSGTLGGSDTADTGLKLELQLRKVFLDKQASKDSIEQFKKDFEELLKGARLADTLTNNFTQAFTEIGGIQFDKEMAQIEAKTKALEEQHALQIEYINGQSLSQEEKQKQIRKQEAITNAQRRRIDREREQTQLRQARLQKASDIASIITGTAVAVISALGAKPYTPANIALATSAGIVGASQLARAIAAPLPQYADGTLDHGGGKAIVGERGAELVVEPSGKSYLTPSSDAIMDLPKHTKVIPHEVLMDYVNNGANKRLANGAVVTTDSYEKALLESFEEVTSEMKGLRSDIKRKSTNVNIYGSDSHNFWTGKFKGNA